jgi:hypothetical protein
MDSTTLYLIFVLLGGAPQIQPAGLATCGIGEGAPKITHTDSAKAADCRMKAGPTFRNADTVVPRAQLRPRVEQ